LEGRVKEVRRLAVGYVRYMGSERRSTPISMNLTGGRVNVGRMQLLDLQLEKLWVACERARLQGRRTGKGERGERVEMVDIEGGEEGIEDEEERRRREQGGRR
jgi:hypothetical protein